MKPFSSSVLIGALFLTCFMGFKSLYAKHNATTLNFHQIQKITDSLNLISSDTAYYFLENKLQECLINKTENEVAQAYLFKATWLKEHNFFSAALETIYECQPLIEKHLSAKNKAHCLYLSGYCKSELSDFAGSINDLKTACHIFDSLHIKDAYYKALNTQAVNFFHLDKFDLASDYFEEIYTYSKANNDTQLIIKSLTNLATINSNSDLNLPKAIAYLQESNELALAIKDYNLAANCSFNLANIFLNSDQLDKAVDNISKAQQLNEKNYNKTLAIYILINKAYIKKQLNQYDSALNFIDKSEQLALEAKQSDLLYEIYTVQSSIFEAKNSFEAANSSLKKALAWKDSLINESILKVTAEFEAKHLIQKKNDQIKINKELLEKQEIQINSQKQRYIYLLLILLLIIALLLFIYNTSKKLNRINTNLKTKNQLINKRNKSLKETLAIRDRLISIIAHDIKNPLATIAGFAELITLSESSADYKKNISHAEHILLASTNLFELLENLLKWAKDQQDGIILKPQNLDTYRIVKNTVQLLHIMSASKNIKVLNHVQKQHHIFADMVTFNTVVRNLLNNAIKFSPDNSSIEIYSKQVEDTVEIYFKDQGLGIAPEDIPLLFNPDIDRSLIGKNYRNKGIGLGLVLCSDFIRQNNGFIHVDSKPGVGSTFIITLPKPFPINNTL